MTKTEVQYFVARNCEDGTTIEGPFTEAGLLRRITPNSDGETAYGPLEGFHESIPKSDGGYWIDGGAYKLLIIRGTIVVPQPDKIITTWKLPRVTPG
jgi:hypothetical protein